jgi:hypothetical protein
VEDNDDNVASVTHSLLTSTIDYNHITEQNFSINAPDGFVPNDPKGCYFYPIYVKNPKFGKWDNEPCLMLTPYIQYSTNYTYVTGSAGRNKELRTVPVFVGHRVHFYQKMAQAKWDDLKRGSHQEFAVNEVLMIAGDPRMTGEITDTGARVTSVPP